MARLAAAHRFGEVQIESGGQQKAVADQPIGRVKCGIVEHLKIQRAMGGASGMETVGCDREGNLASPWLGQNDVRLKQPIDRCRVVQRLSARKCAALPVGTPSGRIPLLGADQHRGHGIPRARPA